MEEGKDKKIQISLGWLDCFKFWFAGFLFLLVLVILSALYSWLK